MMWGTFHACDGIVHIMPCDDDGRIVGGHVRQAYCPCGPHVAKQIGSAYIVVVHDQPDADPTLH